MKTLEKYSRHVWRFLTTHPLTFTFILSLVIGFLSYGYWIVTNNGTAITQIDTFWQQVPFYRDGWDKVHESSFTFWSWNNMQGNDYYASNLLYFIWSPFFRIITFFPKEWIPQMMLIMNVLKFALGGLFFALFLKVFGYKKWYTLVIGGVLYAYSGPMIINVFFNHFNDYFAFFPLLLVSAEYYLKKKRIWLSFTLAFLTIISPYFATITFSIFAAYLIVRWLLINKFTIKTFLHELLLAVFFSALGFGMALFALLPFVLFTISNPRVGSLSDIKGFLDYYPFHYGFAIPIFSLPTLLFPPSRIQAFEPFYNMSILWQSLSLFATSLPLLMLPQLKKFVEIKSYRKIFVFALGLFLFLLLPFLNHLVAFLSNMTYRWSYLVVAFMIFGTAHVIENFKLLHRGKLINTGICIAFLMTSVVALSSLMGPIAFNSSYIMTNFIIRNALPSLIFLIFFVTVLTSNRLKKFTIPLLIAGISIQSVYTTSIYIAFNSNESGNVINYSELNKRQTRSEIINSIFDENNVDPKLDRVWIDEYSTTDYSQFAFNQSLYYGVNNQLIYHSNYNTSTNLYYQWTHGFTYDEFFWARNVEMNQVFYNNLNINYIISQTKYPNFLPSQFQLISTKETSIGTYYLYENTGSIGFFQAENQYITPDEISSAPAVMVPKLLNDYVVVSSSDAEKNNLTHAVITPNLEYLTSNQKTLSRLKNLIWTNETDFTVTTKTSFAFDREVDSGEYIFYNTKNSNFFINDVPIDTSNYCLPETSRTSIPCKLIALPFHKGDKIHFELEPNSYSLTTPGALFGYNKLTNTNDYEIERNSRKVDYTFDSFDSNGFSSTINMPDSTFVTFSVPYAEGSTFYLNGVEVEPTITNGGYLGLKLEKGTNKLEMRYVTPGFKIGFISSIIIFIISVLTGIFRYFKYHKKRNKL